VVGPERGRPALSTLVGVLPGEGIGPEVIAAALDVLRAVERAGGQEVDLVLHDGPIGRAAEREHGTALPDPAVRFCDDVHARGGAVLNGPGGGRYVYDLRVRLDLFLKISPIQVRNGLADASPLRPEVVGGVDLLLVRENVGGMYQGRSAEDRSNGDRVVRHSFSYAERSVRRFLDAAARLARSRSGTLTVVTKEAGAPGVSRLWRRCAGDAAGAHGVGCTLVDVDLIAYQLVRRPTAFDVVAAPNLYGDVLGDLAAALVGSRGLSFSGNFAPAGAAVYQTNHGAAYDIAGTDRANPAGQILSLAMLLRESFGLRREAAAIEAAVQRVWADGWRTADLGTGEQVVGTRRLGELVADAVADQLGAAARAA